MKKHLITLSLVLAAFVVFGQNDNIIPVQVKEKFSNFTLEDHNGKDFTLSDYTGKKVMLVFIRGKATEEVWCPICQYQYMEFLKIDEEYKIRKKHNMEIAFVMPYSKDSLENWKKAFPKSLATIEAWKNPTSTSQGAIDWSVYCKEFFPYTFKFDSKNFKLKFPVLFDVDKKVSKGLMLFKEEWGGTKVAQNVPTIFIIDEKGKVGFKYHSQMTNDRPDVKYLMKYLENMF